MLFLTDDIITDAKLPEEFGLIGEDGDGFDDNTFCAFEDVVCALWGVKWFNYSHGISKVVVISIEGDYVYKFPFSGYFDEEDNLEYNEDTDTYDVVGDPEFCKFQGAYGEDSSDYCNAEIELLNNYNAWYDGKFNKMFPSTDRVQVKGIMCYKQERCYCLVDISKESTHSPSESVASTNANKGGFDEDWIGEVEYRYGTEYTLDFLDFADDHLEDMHPRNYGYSCVDGRPVIIDWAGYND